MSDDGLASDRRQVRDRLGSGFEDKASDALCAYILRPPPNLRGWRRPGVVLELADAPDDLAIPPGFAPPPEPDPDALPPVRMRGGLRGGPGPGEEEGPVIERDPDVEQARLRSLASMEPVRAFLQQASPGGPAMRGGGGGGAPILFDVCWLNHTVRARVQPASVRRIADLAGDARVQRIDVTRALQRELRRSVQTLLEGMARVEERAVRARPILTGRDVVVAVIDSEIQREHPALLGRVFRRRRFTSERWGRPSRHGTAVAGVIAAQGELVGMAPEAILYNYKVLGCTDADDADDFDLGLALQEAVRDRARIANLSLGTTARTDGRSREVRACDRAWKLGLTIVKSAGNRGNAPETITCPGDADGVIVVGATDVDGLGVQHYSSRGPTLNHKTRPDLVAPGGIDEIATIDSCLPDGTFGCCGYGTTLAAAHVSGLLALMLEENPRLTPDQLRACLIARCTPLRGDENVQGAGLVRWAAGSLSPGC